MVPLLLTTFAMNGWLIMNLWNWFLTSFGLPHIGFCHAIGLWIIVCAVKQSRAPKEPIKETIKDMVVRGILTPMVALLIAWMVHEFMVTQW